MSTTTVARTACKYPGCEQPAAPAAGIGRPPEYCAGRGHTRVSAWRERRRLAAEQAGTTISPAEDGSPLATARTTGVELLRSLRAEADRITALGAGLRERIDPHRPDRRRSRSRGGPRRRRAARRCRRSPRRRRGTARRHR
jgi:colicin import membrane protein